MDLIFGGKYFNISWRVYYGPAMYKIGLFIGQSSKEMAEPISHLRDPVSSRQALQLSPSTIWSIGWASYPIGSMYAIYGNICHLYTPNTWILWVCNLSWTSNSISGCWFFATPLKNMTSSIGMMKFQIYGKMQKNSNQTTNQIYHA